MFQHRSHKLQAIFTLILLVFAAGAAAQDWSGKGRLQGKVSDPEGNPIEGVKVTLLLRGQEGVGPEPITTNKKGRWSFLGLVTGDWTILLDKEGYRPSQAGPIKVFEQGVNPAVNVEMRPFTKEELGPTADEKRQLLDKANDLLAAGKNAEARAAYEEALGMIPEESHPDVLRAIGSTYQNEGNFAQARATYEKAFALGGSTNLALLHDVARTYYEEKATDQAVATLEKALAVVPGDETTLRLIVDILVAAGREDDAQPYIAQLPQGSKMDPNTLLNMGINLVNQGDTEGALQYFDRATQENPNLADVYYYRGLAYLQNGRNEEAKTDFKKLLELEPNHAKASEVQQFLEYLESQ